MQASPDVCDHFINMPKTRHLLECLQHPFDKGLKGAASIPTDDHNSTIRRCRNNNSLTFLNNTAKLDI